jgi:hypothetical protein
MDRSTPARFRLIPRLLLLLVAVGMALSSIAPLHAQDDVRTFPETGYSLQGLFRTFWEANGGVANFGFPISDEFTADTGRTTQWFERARFELVEIDGQPQVQLGQLGSEITAGRIFPKVPPIENTEDRRYIPETQHIIQYGFKEIWETRGDVAIFGYPISEEIDEVLDDGEWHTVQYFENARFEYWPDFPPGERVLISLLGRMLIPDNLAVVPEPEPLPANVNAQVQPESGPPGTSFVLSANGFTPGEPVGIWLTGPDQTVYPVDAQPVADDEGTIDAARVAVVSEMTAAEGIWAFNAQGIDSGAQAVGHFRISRAAAPGNPDNLGRIVHDDLPTQGVAAILPVAAAPGASFILVGGGFADGEEVSAWISTPDGNTLAVADSAVSYKDDGVVHVRIATGDLAEGAYTAVAQGRESGTQAVATFLLTREFIAGPGTTRPANVNGSASPVTARAGDAVQIRAEGFMPGETVEYWLTDANGAYTLFAEQPVADASGRVGYDPAIDLEISAELSPGVYGVHYRGSGSGVRADIYFTIVE